jgi:hypothetical protein
MGPTTQCTTEYELAIPFGPYRLSYSKDTPVESARLQDRELVILGLAVDVRNGVGEDVAENALSSTRTLQDLLAYEAFLGGKYILFYKDSTGAYAIPDATASMSFCYTAGGSPELYATDSEQIAQKLSLKPDVELLGIRNSGDLSQAMPYDLTVYKEIKQLLPNHYFSFSERKALRFVDFTEKKCSLSPKEAAALTAPLIKNLLQFYKTRFKLYCPLTSGWDSRTVLAMMLSMDQNIESYTIRHNNFSNVEPDIVIPKQISAIFPVTNIQIPDLEPDEQMIQSFDQQFCATGYSKRTLMIANTIKASYGDGAVVNGDIIGQVGKCSLHRDIPEIFATPRYFRCKLHNYSRASVLYLKRWMKDIEASGEQVNLFDLFSLESRMGRWAAQENLIYGLIGQKYLNIFNSRSIIYPWTRVPRKDRKRSKIHQELIALTYPELMQIPVGGRPSFAERLTKLNGITYYLASFVKYYYERFSFLHKQKKGRN